MQWYNELRVVVPFYPMLATGMLLAGDGAKQSMRFAGSCAAYLRRHIFLTATHCTTVAHGESLLVMMQAETGTRIVKAVIPHPTVDVAVVVTDPAEEDSMGFRMQVYGEIDGSLMDGGDFIGFGYPVEGSATGMPVGRLFKGHLQRSFGYDPPSGGSRYLAGEMSIPAPAGFSGGPLAWSHTPDRPIAVVTTNHDSYVILDRIEQVEQDGKVYRESTSRVVSYGIAAMLSGLKTWVDDVVSDHLEP